MKILITGANGYLGARIYFDLSKNYEVIGTYHTSALSKSFVKLDITNPKEVHRVLSENRPDIIIHIAANAKPSWCKQNPKEAVLINETSTKYIVEEANKISAKVIYISSFAAYEHKDLYGETKYHSEQTVKKNTNGWVILRPNFILGFSPNTTNDRPFNRLLKNLDEGTPAEYDTSWKFQPTYIGHISEIIKEVIDKEINHETIPIAVDVLKSRYDTARDILAPFGVKVTPIEPANLSSPSKKEDLSKLTKLKLPVYNYKEMIQRIVTEIKNRKYFKLD